MSQILEYMNNNNLTQESREAINLFAQMLNDEEIDVYREIEVSDPAEFITEIESAEECGEYWSMSEDASIDMENAGGFNVKCKGTIKIEFVDIMGTLECLTVYPNEMEIQIISTSEIENFELELINQD